MPSSSRSVESLRPTDLMTHPVWEFASDDEPDETSVHPVDERPIKSSENRIVGTEVELANGSRVWILLGNIDITDARRTRHFLTMSVFVRNEWFHLARYHDVDREVRGPAQLAQALALGVEDIFPIRYDIGSCLSAPRRTVLPGVSTPNTTFARAISRAELIDVALQKRNCAPMGYLLARGYGLRIDREEL